MIPMPPLGGSRILERQRPAPTSGRGKLVNIGEGRVNTIPGAAKSTP
jgi:hypothetical protein